MPLHATYPPPCPPLPLSFTWCFALATMQVPLPPDQELLLALLAMPAIISMHHKTACQPISLYLWPLFGSACCGTHRLLDISILDPFSYISLSFFILDLFPPFVSPLLASLPSDIIPSHFLRPCTTVLWHTIPSCLFLYSPDTSFHMTPCSLLLAELHSLFPPFTIPSFPCIAHIVLSFWTQYIYPSPALVKARQTVAHFFPTLLRPWALGPHFSFLSWPLCTYMITWPRLTWPLTCTTEPSHWKLHCSLLLYISYCSLLMVVCDHHCLWPHCSVTLIVCDSIVPCFCMLSQIAALLYISWTYILELGLKPDLVCNLLHSLSLLLEPTFPFHLSLRLSSNPWRYSPFLFIFTQTLVLVTFSLLSPSKSTS